MNVEISRRSDKISCTIALSGSKSITNRVQIIQAVSGLRFKLENFSASEDSLLLKRALDDGLPELIDVNHAGTSFRFLTALLAVTPGTYQLTGSERLRQRPIGELVDVLRSLGAEISYTGEEGFPPLKISGKKLTGGNIAIRGDISSQFISALLLVSPSFENGLALKISTPLVSRPYVNMTVELMRAFGIAVAVRDNQIEVTPGNYAYAENTLRIEGDWSSAGYWYEIAALANEAEIRIENLFPNSVQADKAVAEIFNSFGVSTDWNNGHLVIKKHPGTQLPPCFSHDFTDCPDAAQTVAATCAGLGVAAELSGLQTLKIKETDRISALKIELSKLGISVRETESSIAITGKVSLSPEAIATYHDHRMAMSFAPLSLITENIRIADPAVVNKSYPAFWSDLEKAGFEIIRMTAD